MSECPATPERVDQCPATPDRLLNVKSPDSSTSSDNECTINLRTRNTNSPPPNCAICLGRCKNKCFTDSCLHQFCFKCLLEWSKVKAECPLCKQPFNSIIHNVKSIEDFEEYLVGPPQQSAPTIPSVPLPIPPAVVDRASYPRQFDILLGPLARYRRPGFSTTVQLHPVDNNALQQIFMHRSMFGHQFRRDYVDGLVSAQRLDQLWRRYIYDRRLYAMPVVDITGRYRECSARFFRDNPAQMHRIITWIERDARGLLGEMDPQHIAIVLDAMRELLPVFNITSPEFRRHSQTFFGQHTAHFIHELLNFARSPFDMIGYDREVRYSPYYEEVIVSSSSSSSGFSDTEEVSVVGGGSSNGGGTTSQRGPGRTEITIESFTTNTSRILVTGTINASGAGSLGSAGVPTASMSPIEIIQVSGARPTAAVQPQILGENPVIQIDRNIVLTSSSSDECEFVSEQKPPHLRTPEQVSLNSESDSDCVFVGESHRTPTIEPQAHAKRKSRVPKGVFISTFRNGSPWPSCPSSETDYEPARREHKSKSKKKKKDKSESETNRPKLTITIKTPDSLKTENALLAPDPAVTEPSATTTQPSPTTNDEYNNGASTSSAVTSGESFPPPPSSSSSACRNTRSQGAVRKYYARPVRQATCRGGPGIGKSIYEESSSDTDESSTEDKKIFPRNFKREKISELDDDESASNDLWSRKNRKRRRQTSSRGAISKKKKSKKSSARKKRASTSSAIVKSSSSKRRKISAATSKTRRKSKMGKSSSSTKRSPLKSSTSSLSSSASTSSSSSSSSSSSTSSSSESTNHKDGYSSSSSD